MKRGIRTTIFRLFGLVLMTAMAVWSAPAGQVHGGVSDDDLEDAIEKVRDARTVFKQVMSKPDKAIPRELLENATGIGIFPNVVKAAFIVGGSGGDGIIMRKDLNGRWAAPVFYDLTSASIGAQIGGKTTDYVILFMNEGALSELEDDKLEFGGDLSFAAGPVGRTLGASTNLKLDSGILTWSRSKGVFAGASLKGAVLTAENDLNKAIYGKRGGMALMSDDSAAKASSIDEFAILKQIITRYSGTSTRNDSAKRNDSSDYKRVKYVNSNMILYPVYGAEVTVNTKERAEMEAAEVAALARRIRSELLTLPYYSVFDWIEFEVGPEGYVVLKGLVTTPPDTAGRAESYVSNIPGVNGVDNRIRALPVSPSDDRLRRVLYRELYSGPLFRYQIGSLQSIHIIVNNGRVSLEGVVDSAEDKSLAAIRANSVPGIFSVTNNLKIRKDGIMP